MIRKRKEQGILGVERSPSNFILSQRKNALVKCSLCLLGRTDKFTRMDIWFTKS